MQMRQPLITN